MVGLPTGDVTRMATFEEFKRAVYDEIRYLMSMANERINVEMIAERDLFPDVFRSALMKDGVKVGKDMFTRRFDFLPICGAGRCGRREHRQRPVRHQKAGL